MPDITMCDGEKCERKESCYRFTATPDDLHQSWFLGSPVKKDGSCEHFWKNDGRRDLDFTGKEARHDIATKQGAVHEQDEQRKKRP